MDKLEKVIKGLECCINEHKNITDCEHCPYSEIDEGCTSLDDLHSDTLDLLKAQQPRVLTLEEVKMLDSDYYYLESMRSHGKELREIVGAYGLTCVTWPSITWARQTMGDSGYGKTWRCWTAKPTREQREAVSWQEI